MNRRRFTLAAGAFVAGMLVSQKPLASNNYQGIIGQAKSLASGEFNELVRGVRTRLDTQERVIALTFDACGGRKGESYDNELIGYLKRENIPATLFISGRWIDSNQELFKELCLEDLFDVQNHGLEHRPLTITGKSAYGIKGTRGIEEVIREVGYNADKIEAVKGLKPKLFRSGTAYYDEASVRIANMLGYEVVNFDVLSGDAVPNAKKEAIAQNITKKVRNGSFVIMHMNKPSWNTKEALEIVVPELRDKGYGFVKIKNYSLL